jgi:dTDP-4-dehydrorhamnose reductase
MKGKSVGTICFYSGNGGFDCEISGIPASDYQHSSTSEYSLLDKSKIKASFGVLVPDYKESLTRCMGLLK